MHHGAYSTKLYCIFFAQWLFLIYILPSESWSSVKGASEIWASSIETKADLETTLCLANYAFLSHGTKACLEWAPMAQAKNEHAQVGTALGGGFLFCQPRFLSYGTKTSLERAQKARVKDEHAWVENYSWRRLYLGPTMTLSRLCQIITSICVRFWNSRRKRPNRLYFLTPAHPFILHVAWPAQLHVGSYHTSLLNLKHFSNNLFLFLILITDKFMNWKLLT